MLFDKHMNLHRVTVVTMLRPMLWGLLMQLYAEWKSLVLKWGLLTGLMRCCGFSRHMRCQLACMPVRFGLCDAISEAWQWFQQSFAGRTHGVVKENFGNQIYFCTLVYASRMRAGTLAILLVQVSCHFWNRMVDSNSNTLCDVLKADISLGNSGALNCWSIQRKDAFGNLQNGAIYKVASYITRSWIFLFCA